LSTDKLSCGVVLARMTDDGYVTLMLRAYHHWDFPKGLLEEGEEPVQAALRELREETGIASAEFEWGERHMETGPYIRGKTARYYLARTNEEKVGHWRARASRVALGELRRGLRSRLAARAPGRALGEAGHRHLEKGDSDPNSRIESGMPSHTTRIRDTVPFFDRIGFLQRG
jgi:8-oxo-dGTP pyrophosphatase MutT (NUDIX family)